MNSNAYVTHFSKQKIQIDFCNKIKNTLFVYNVRKIKYVNFSLYFKGYAEGAIKINYTILHKFVGNKMS